MAGGLQEFPVQSMVACRTAAELILEEAIQCRSLGFMSKPSVSFMRERRDVNPSTSRRWNSLVFASPMRIHVSRDRWRIFNFLIAAKANTLPLASVLERNSCSVTVLAVQFCTI
jgi:hypothetical protein